MGRFARMAIYINFDKPFVSQVWINREIQKLCMNPYLQFVLHVHAGGGLRSHHDKHDGNSYGVQTFDEVKRKKRRNLRDTYN
ncbi:hypothetical protein Gotri_025992, partial [Gossypium trilobum]|nr:hypothetical protein [Gossypium trilobum]